MTTVNQRTGELRKLIDLSDDDLLDEYKHTQTEVAKTMKQDGHVEQEIHRRLESRGADKLYGVGLEYVNETKSDPDRSKIPPLMEYLTPAEVTKCLTPAHWEEPQEPKWIEDKYDLTQVKKAIKDHGGDAQVKLDSIYFPGTPKGKLVRVETQPVEVK